MYQVIGIKNTALAFLVLTLAIFALINHGEIVKLLDQPVDLLRALSSASSLAGFTFLILGESFIFPWICKLPIARTYFPPIDGEWDVTLQSNWGVIERLRGNAEVEEKTTKQGKVKIFSRFFRVRMQFEANDRYSKSSTVSVAIHRDCQHGTIELNYIYENLTSNPKIADCSRHNGAARVQVRDEDGKVSMEGVYFTDRNWSQGLNTAGYISFERALTQATGGN
ncbi:hypothetical protein DN820_09430 [Stutzerimonas nosocomialis]|uniref:CD-NTase-associated protein 15 domain-containing protein n=1 Tax=Stutzerimonas nosocomialis TaxID=1056496 RepID=A0A5R9QFC0_9GAMM|nr:hypothetical protein [Stutzerimonas nosocomialis]TLX63608.1 hypothetical protein DN820_09430 [Stutzerimonas nosocomialis]